MIVVKCGAIEVEAHDRGSQRCPNFSPQEQPFLSASEHVETLGEQTPLCSHSSHDIEPKLALRREWLCDVNPADLCLTIEFF